MGIPPVTRVSGQQTKVYGELTEHGEVIFLFDRGKRKKRAAKTFLRSSISARGLGKTGRLGRDQENRYLASAVLTEYKYAAEHLRGVVSEEGDRLGKDENRQEDKLLNYEDSTFRSRRPSSVEVSTEPPRELEESSRDDLDIGTALGRTVQFGMTKAYPTVWPLPSKTRTRWGRGKPACPPRAGSS